MKTVALLSVFFIFPILAFGANDIQSTNSSGIARNSFEDFENIYVGGECTAAADRDVDIYIVDNESSWSSGDDLDDVSGKVEETEADGDGVIKNVRIWNDPLEPGEYDIVLDANQNGRYDSQTDCIDGQKGRGFTVEEPDARVEVTSDRENFDWVIDESDRKHLMLALEIETDGVERVRISEFEIQASGTGNERQLNDIEIYLDSDEDARYDKDDELMGSAIFEEEDERISIEFDESYLMKRNSVESFFIVYNVTPSLMNEGETYQVTLRDIDIVGAISDDRLDIIGLSLKSGITTVRPEGYIAPEKPETDEKDNVEETNEPENDGIFGGIFGRGDDTSGETEDKEFKIPEIPIAWRAGFLAFILFIILWRIVSAALFHLRR